GACEAEGACCGGWAKNRDKWGGRACGGTRHGQQGASGKTMVAGILERGGTVRASVVPDVTGERLRGHIRQHVAPGSKLSTDSNPSYRGLEKEYDHQTVNHFFEEYVRGEVHTNGIENFWRLLKRGLNGTYINVEPFHLFRYLDEQIFRFNSRKTDN